MGGEQLAGVLEIIQRESAAKKGVEINEAGLATMKAMFQAQIDKESQALFATARLWDDGIIDPRHTRDVLGITLSTVATTTIEGSLSWGVFRH